MTDNERLEYTELEASYQALLARHEIFRKDVELCIDLKMLPGGWSK